MIRFDLDIKTIYKSLYAAGKLPFPGILKASNDTKSQDYPNLIDTFSKGSQDSKWWSKNDLGRWVFCPVKLDGLYMPNPLISITGQKNIVDTPLINGEGSVKEIIQTNDYQIKILIVCASNDGTYPDDQVKNIRDKWKLDSVLTLESPVTDFFIQKENNFVLKDIDVPAVRGVMNTQVIELSGVSDTYFELEIK